MKIISVGDIHGRDAWKFLTHGSPYEYEIWRTAVDHGADPKNNEFWSEYPYTQVDKIVFVGDYADSFTISNVEILNTIKEIIHFREAVGDKVILLIGNHDIQYIVANEICSGYRGEMRVDLYELFHKNLEYFKFAHEETGIDGNKFLWTHAGVTSGWYKELKSAMNNPNYRFFTETRDLEDSTIADTINKAWELRMNLLYNVDFYSGGSDTWAGPIWVRPQMLNTWPIEGYNQIIGHTPQGSIWECDENEDKKKFNNFKHYFIDCLEFGDQKGLTLNI